MAWAAEALRNGTPPAKGSAIKVSMFRANVTPIICYSTRLRYFR